MTSHKLQSYSTSCQPLPTLSVFLMNNSVFAPAAPNGNGEERDVAGKSAIALSPPF